MALGRGGIKPLAIVAHCQTVHRCAFLGRKGQMLPDLEVGRLHDQHTSVILDIKHIATPAQHHIHGPAGEADRLSS